MVFVDLFFAIEVMAHTYINLCLLYMFWYKTSEWIEQGLVIEPSAKYSNMSLSSLELWLVILHFDKNIQPQIVALWVCVMLK